MRVIKFADILIEKHLTPVSNYLFMFIFGAILTRNPVQANLLVDSEGLVLLTNAFAFAVVLHIMQLLADAFFSSPDKVKRS